VQIKEGIWFKDFFKQQINLWVRMSCKESIDQGNDISSFLMESKNPCVASLQVQCLLYKSMRPHLAFQFGLRPVRFVQQHVFSII